MEYKLLENDPAAAVAVGGLGKIWLELLVLKFCLSTGLRLCFSDHMFEILFLVTYFH